MLSEKQIKGRFLKEQKKRENQKEKTEMGRREK